MSTFGSINPTKYERGFSLMEVLISSGISSVVMAMIISSVMVVRDGFYTDVVRTRINSNLRSSTDIIAMNIRQAGENLQRTFPAILVTDEAIDGATTLTLRRNLVPEILTLCTAASSGTQSLYVSSSSNSNSACIASNVEPLYDVFDELRVDNGNSLRIFIYDRSAQVGEFLNFTTGGQSGGEYYLFTNSISRDYPALQTSIYAIEEYSFELDSENETLQLFIDGDITSPQAVAFSISDFSVELTMDDGNTLTSFSETDEKNWKEIRNIKISLAGNEAYKGETISNSMTAEYFPRNVLSYDG
ncbi:MAG: prepilin-type N-terminal cleavage/methylation domain-containing protein [Bdellovibrionales bacterium]|nr:prepilin-type N-terminal cleavage/methylation domain-containing protein [Bdellovibrionales bacterium]